MSKTIEMRSVIKTTRNRPSIYKQVEKVMKKKKWSYTQCVEEGLLMLINSTKQS